MEAPGRFGDERGSSLIEVAVASAMFAIVLLGFTPSVINATRATRSSDNNAAAVTLAQDKLEWLRSLASTNANLTAGTHSDTLNPLKANGTTGGIYTRSWTVTNDTPAKGMKRVEMTVSWPEVNGPAAITVVAVEMP
jgi:Tfp pilus assembly protein PilV